MTKLYEKNAWDELSKKFGSFIYSLLLAGALTLYGPGGADLAPPPLLDFSLLHLK